MTADLFTAAAERSALASGRPLSQELAEIRLGAQQPFIGDDLHRELFETCEHGATIDAECLLCEPILDGFATIDVITDRSRTSDVRPLFYDTAEEAYGNSVRTGRAVVVAKELQTCRQCGSTYHAAPRADSTCNLCRRPQC